MPACPGRQNAGERLTVESYHNIPTRKQIDDLPGDRCEKALSLLALLRCKCPRCKNSGNSFFFGKLTQERIRTLEDLSACGFLELEPAPDGINARVIRGGAQ